MQRKELKREIKKYSNKTKFYKLSLIRRLVRLKEARMKKILADIPKVVCPHCGSRQISTEQEEGDWDSSYWLYCDNCSEHFDDTFGLAIALNELNTEPYFDIVELELYEMSIVTDGNYHCLFNKEHIKRGVVWREFCEKEIRGMLGEKTKEELNWGF